MPPWGSFEVLHIAQRVTSGFSLIGSSTVCFLYFYLKWWESSTHHVILFYISVADILFSTTFLIGPMAFSSADWCTFQGWKVHMFGLATQIWCTFLGLNLLLQMKFYWKDWKCRELMVKYHAIAWGIPFILSTVPAAQDFMVPLGTWCWITSDEPNWRLWAMYVPLWINFGINACVIYMIIRLFRQVLACLPEGMDNIDKVKRHYRFITFQTLMFVLGGMFCWFVSTISRVLQAFRVDEIPFEIYFFQGLLLPVQGIFNLLVYVAPVHLQKFCCNAVYNSSNEKTVSTENYSFPVCADLGDDIPEVQLTVNEIFEDDYNDKPRYDQRLGSRSTNLTRSSTFQKFRRLNKSMSFYDGPGLITVDIVRETLSTPDYI